MPGFLAPIAFFAYRRLHHLRRSLEALAANPEAATSDLIVFADAAATAALEPEVDAVRRHLGEVSGFRSVTIIERERNLGLANSVIQGVTEVLRQHERVIVVEDDLITSPFFLRYMNEALAYYEHDDRVASVHAYVYPVRDALPETFFLRGADCWGWATWRRAWQLFNPDGRFLLSELWRLSLIREFDLNGAYPYSRMLERQVAGENDSWAVRWHATMFLQRKLTLYPGRALARNIGNDRSGTHAGRTSRFDVVLTARPIRVGEVAVEESPEGRAAIEAFFRVVPSRVAQVKELVREWIPPGILRVLRRLGGARWGGTRFRGEFASWDEAVAASSGYDHPAILEKVAAATLRVKRSEAAYERDSVPFDRVQYSWPLVAGLAWAAARNGGRLCVLDYGGSLGTSYFQHRELFRGLAEVRWGVVEQPHYIARGRVEIADEHLRFFDNVAECAAHVGPDVIVLGSILQYLPDPLRVLRELSATKATVMIIDRTPVADIAEDRITVQHVPPSIYRASYPCRILSRPRLLEELRSSWTVLDAFTCAEGVMRTDGGLRFAFEGVLLYR